MCASKSPDESILNVYIQKAQETQKQLEEWQASVVDEWTTFMKLVSGINRKLNKQNGKLFLVQHGFKST